MGADAWAKTLFTYGPFAILVFLVFVAERKLWKKMKDGPSKERRPLLLLYVANWLVIFGLVVFSVYAWKKMNLDNRPQIRGTIEDVSDSEILSSRFEDLYLHRIRQDNDVYSNYEWLLVNKEKPFVEGETIVFTIDRSTPNSEVVYDYDLPIQANFYNVKVQLRRDKDDLYLTGQGKPLAKRSKTIEAPSETTTRVAPLLGLFDTVAYAQTQSQKPFSVNDLAIGLDSPDALVRRETRADLANLDQGTALPWIDKVLQDQKSSYRLKLGVIVALNNMSGLRGESLTPSTISGIQSALSDPDFTLRNEALKLAKRYDFVPVTVYEDINYSGRSQGFGAGRYRADKGQLGKLPNDSASSVRVAKGFRVRLCENEGSGNGGGICEEKGPGSYQFKWAPFGSIADKVSYIEVTASKK
jgi:hypothetical protein